MVSIEDKAWLAGFWDGEGSVGIAKSGTTYILNAQMSHTDITTVRHVLNLLEQIGGTLGGGRGYTYQERDPSKHKDAHYLRIGGVARVLNLAETLLPYAVTKKPHWEIAIIWAARRISVAGGVDDKGHLFRGNDPKLRPYFDEDVALYERMKALNRRGPGSAQNEERGRIVLD